MRGKEANAGSLRVLLLILALLVANLVASNARHPERSVAQSKGPAAERATSSGNHPRAQDLERSGQHRFVDVRPDPSAALGMTEEHTP